MQKRGNSNRSVSNVLFAHAFAHVQGWFIFLYVLREQNSITTRF